MYSNDERHINWLDIIIKLLFGALFIIILIWLFRDNVPNMKAFYSNVFRENIKYMQDAGESYFTNERLPKEKGESAKLTLQQMYDKGLVLPFVDKDGNSCNVYSSYVEVTKGDNEYVLKTNLVCNKETNYINKILGCYDYCEDCVEEPVKKPTVTPTKNTPVNNTTLQYQFKRVTGTGTTNSCPSGYTLSGSTCVKNNLQTVAPTYTTEKVLSSVKSATATTQTKKEYLSYILEKNIYEYTCPTGYDLTSNNTCQRVETTSKINTMKHQTYCPQGKLSGNSCIISIAATTRKIYSGTTLEYVCTASNCPGMVTVPKYTYEYSCPSGYSRSGSTCSKTVEASSKIITNMTCPSGYNDNGSSCIKTTYASASYEKDDVSYSCPNGYTLEYEKRNGTLDTTSSSVLKSNVSSAKCYTEVKADPTYSCTNGGEFNSSNKQCYYYSYKQSAPKCATGYTLNSNNICQKYVTTTIAPTVVSNGVVTYEYTWSNSSSLNGWIFTGNTRKVNI